jgi:hypothetical protein
MVARRFPAEVGPVRPNSRKRRHLGELGPARGVLLLTFGLEESPGGEAMPDARPPGGGLGKRSNCRSMAIDSIRAEDGNESE